MADIETVLIENEDKINHVPYAAGLMRVIPGEMLPPKDSIIYWYSEDFITEDSFASRSKAMMNSFLRFMEKMVKREKRKKIIYFHNFSRFDGILLISHIITNIPEWEVKPLMINNELYQLEVFSGKKKIMTFRDSLKLLPGSLKSLGNSLCPRREGRC